MTGYQCEEGLRPAPPGDREAMSRPPGCDERCKICGEWIERGRAQAVHFIRPVCSKCKAREPKR